MEELEALRLAHLESLYQEAAAREMGISRQTFGRLLDQAHGKVARALCEGLALRIEGGAFHHQPTGTCRAQRDSRRSCPQEKP